MDDFVAIDFETANSNRDSACSVGLVVVREGIVAETYASLIRPPMLDFNPMCVKKHGITPGAVKDAPRFADVWPEIERRCAHHVLVAHNASFDVGVLCACIAQAGCARASGRYICTLELARAVLPGLDNHRLCTLALVFGIPLRHHDAASDARACAEVAIRLFRLAGPCEIGSYCSSVAEFDEPHESEGNAVVVETSIAWGNAQNLSLALPAATDHRFDGLRFVLTGEFGFLPRNEAEDTIRQKGGKVTGSVSKKTNYVVVSDEVYAQYRQSGQTTTKHATAMVLKGMGAPIEIIDENKFRQMIE